MSNKRIYRGSEWIKTDLQLHTPGTKLNDKFEGDSPTDKWENFLVKLESSDLRIIGITDYFSVDGYEKILKFKKDGRLSNIDLILPNIEFRMDRQNDRGHFINLHLLFADSKRVTVQKLNSFLSSLEIFPTDRHKRRLHCNDEDIRSAGGFDKIAIEVSKLATALESFVPLKDYVIIGVPSGYGNFSSTDGGRGTATALEFDKLSHMMFGNEKDRLFFLNERNGITVQKPVLATSDAHQIEDIGSKYCWIKADPTYDGLLQTIYEPEIRVSLETDTPRYLHPQIISLGLQNVSNYKSATDKDKCPLFGLNNAVAFSANLSTIIGARAAGKSILAELVSFLFDKHQVEPSHKHESLPFLEFLAKEYPDTEVVLTYKIGEDVTTITRKVTDYNNQFYESPFNIEYWPQGRVEEVADDPKKIALYLKRMLSSPNLNAYETRIDDAKVRLSELRKKYGGKHNLEIEIHALRTQIEGVKSYIKKLNTPECKQLLKDIDLEKTKLAKILSFVGSIDDILEMLQSVGENVSLIELPEQSELESLFDSDKDLRVKLSSVYDFHKKLDSQTSDLEDLRKSVDSSDTKTTIVEEIQRLENELLQYAQENKIEVTKEQYDSKSKHLKDLEDRIKQLEFSVRKSESAKEKYIDLVKDTRQQIEAWGIENNSILEAFNAKLASSKIKAIWNDPDSNLESWLVEQFLASDKYFSTNYAKKLRVRSPVKANNVQELVQEIFQKYDIDEIIDFLNTSTPPTLNDNTGKKDTIAWFFENDKTQILREDLGLRLMAHLEIGEREIQYDGKVLGKQRMSFGERCGTMLEVILSSEECPIILDQPEDHLDSSLLVSRIIPLLRDKKSRRQILICTHNANIVVLGDSELVTGLVSNSGSHEVKGSIEDPRTRSLICNTLEGGIDALRKRSERINPN